MKDHPDNQEAKKTPAEEIAKCISDELGIDIDPNSYRELIARIEKTFKHYVRLRMGKDPGFPLFDIIEACDNAISSLNIVSTRYIVLPDYEEDDLIDLYKKYLSGEGTQFIVDGSGTQKGRMTKIDSVRRDLRNLKNNILGVVKDTNPIATLIRKNPGGWLVWGLFIALRRTFSKPATHDYQLDNAIYSLLKLKRVQKGESIDKARMIRKRRKRFQEEIEPHLPPTE